MTDEITRRKAIGGIGGLTVAALAGCSDTVSSVTGPDFEEGDEQEVMLEASWFGDEWTEEEIDDEESEDDDEDDDDDEDVDDFDFDPDEVEYVEAMYMPDDESGAAMAVVAILEDEDDAEEVVEEYGRTTMVSPEDPEIGDNSIRGEVSSMGVICFSLSNAFVLTGAASISGFNFDPDHGTTLEAAEEIESRLEDL